MGASDFIQELAQRIRRRYLEPRGGVQRLKMPSQRELARTFGVSRKSAASALRLLEAAKAVRLFPRRRGEAAVPPPVRLPPASGSETLLETLAAEIRLGQRKSGSRLPKIAYLAREFRISTAKVIEVLNRLAEREWIRKDGKKWLVGGPQRHVRPGLVSSRFILLVQPKPMTWENLRTPRTHKFVDTFTAEAETHGIRLSAALDSHGGSIPVGISCIGLESMARYIRKHREFHIGTLVVGMESQYRNFPRLMQALSRLGPVAWLDRNDESVPQKFRHPDFLRVCFSEREIARTAAAYLCRRGHRRFLFPMGAHGDPQNDWRLHRFELLLREMRSLAPGTEMDSFQSRPVAAYLKGWSLEALAHRLEKRGKTSPLVSKLTAYLGAVLLENRRLWPREFAAASRWHLTADLILDWPTKWKGEVRKFYNLRELTVPLLCGDYGCMVAPNDKNALFISRELHTMGVDIPGDIAMISFDNYFSDLTLPVTTVDFGAANAGYRAFHWLLKDIGLESTPEGVLVAQPLVIERDSVPFAPPASST